MEVFPLNYLRNSFSPKLSFKNRNYLKIWQMIVLILVLTGCLLMPISISLGKINQVTLIDYVPKAMNLVSEELVQEINQLSFNEQTLLITEEQILMDNDEGLLALYPEDVDLPVAKDFIIFTPTTFYIQEVDRPLISQPYRSVERLTSVNSTESLIQELSQQWFESNRMAVVLTNFINVWVLIFLSTLMVILGSSLFISFMRFSDIFSIKSYREAIHLSLHSMLIPTLIAAVVGLLTQNPTTMLTLQGIAFVLVLLWVYWKTHFRDEYILKQEEKSNHIINNSGEKLVETQSQHQRNKR